MEFDYIEFTLCEEREEGDARKTDIHEDAFARYMEKARACVASKPFQVDHKEYIYGNLHLTRKVQDESCVETKAYQLAVKQVEDRETYRAVYYERKKLAATSFPSTMDTHMTTYKRRLIFRINNRIYLNFQHYWHDDAALFRKVYINYNISKDVDFKADMADIHALISQIMQ